VQDPARDHEALSRAEGDRPSLEIDDELAFNDVEELVVGVVLMPVILSLHHTEAEDCVIHLAEGLVVPLKLAGVDQRLEVDNFESGIEDVEARLVGISGGLGHSATPRVVSFKNRASGVMNRRPHRLPTADARIPPVAACDRERCR
jgi:hypothetical protein